MDARKLTTVEEHSLGSGDDRVFLDNSGHWWWQSRGYSVAYGPFDSRDEAEADYNAT